MGGRIKKSWNRKKNTDNTLAPSTIGNIIVKIPKLYINVMAITFFRSLKTLPKYEGNKNEMQQGANNATIPATNEANNETWYKETEVIASKSLSPPKSTPRFCYLDH